MRAKLAKQIRQAFKQKGENVLGPAQLVIAKSTPKMVYEINPQTNLPEGKVIKRLTIQNLTKVKYRRVKKEVMKQPRQILRG